MSQPDQQPSEPPMREQFKLPLLLLIAGGILTAVHDYAYRRVDQGTGDYELYGLVSHAGSDMLIVTIVLTMVAVAWERGRRR